jgi:hypothetical protein
VSSSLPSATPTAPRARSWLRGGRGLWTAGTLLGILLAPLGARADAVVRDEPYGGGDAFQIYPVEIEPHFTFGPDNVYGGAGIGGGLRIGVPFIRRRLGSVPSSLAINFGADVLHYDNCYMNDCGATYLMTPVALQWNLAVARRVSLFVEGGAYFYKGWFDGCPSGTPGCDAPSDIGVLPTVAVGGRIHLSRGTALTLRLGYPTTTLGVSFL